MSACYGVAFMGVAAEWFWGRWFAAGLGWSGVMVARRVVRHDRAGRPCSRSTAGVHGLVVLALAGKKMAERFDLQPALARALRHGRVRRRAAAQDRDARVGVAAERDPVGPRRPRSRGRG